MKSWLLRILTVTFTIVAGHAHAQTTIKFGYLADPSHEAVMWALKNGKVKSDKIVVEATPLNISALIQATAARTYAAASRSSCSIR